MASNADSNTWRRFRSVTWVSQRSVTTSSAPMPVGQWVCWLVSPVCTYNVRAGPPGTKWLLPIILLENIRARPSDTKWLLPIALLKNRSLPTLTGQYRLQSIGTDLNWCVLIVSSNVSCCDWTTPFRSPKTQRKIKKSWILFGFIQTPRSPIRSYHFPFHSFNSLSLHQTTTTMYFSGFDVEMTEDKIFDRFHQTMINVAMKLASGSSMRWSERRSNGAPYQPGS